jgi:glycosyltransferase involved in cell wall biosynthesis
LKIVQANLQERWGGGEEVTRLLGRGLRERGHEVRFLTFPGSPLAERVAAEQFPVLPLPARSQLDPRALLALTRQLQGARVDVLHLQTAREALFGSLAGRLARVPVIVITRHMATPVRPAMRWVYNRACDAVVCVARAVQESLLRAGVRRERTCLIHAAIDVPHFCDAVLPREEARRRLGWAPGQLLVGIVGALLPGKGHATFLEAAARLREAGYGGRFVIAGDGPLRARLEARAKALGLGSAVLFLGFRSDVAAVISAFDVFVFASAGTEAFPLALLEAMAAGRPVVTTRTGGTPEIVEEGVTGLLVPPGDPQRMAAAVDRLLRDRLLAARLAGAARERVARRYDARQMAAATEALYASLVGARRGTRG